MFKKKLKSLALSALVLTFVAACSDNASPAASGDEVNSLGDVEGASQQVKSVEKSQSDVAESSSSEAESSSDVFDILFPNGVTMDTSRHDPDSVGVWHFYDSKESHMNPAFAYGEMTDPRDGIVYKTTQIGGKTWMAENLNYFDIEGGPSSIMNDWCYWDKPENCESAGRLYTWKVAKRICPEGWRLPTSEDWTALLKAVGADSMNTILWKGAGKLKSINGWENDGNGTDDYGFTALPAGKKFVTKVQDGFSFHGCSAFFWASTEAEEGAADTLAFHMNLDCSNDNVIINTTKKNEGLSVRCVKE